MLGRELATRGRQKPVKLRVEQLEKIEDAHFSREIGQSCKLLTAMSDRCSRLALCNLLRLESGAGTSPGGVYM